MQTKQIAQGAEAILLKKGKILEKRRIEKSYRHKILDEKLRKQRTKREARLLETSSTQVNVPKVRQVNKQSINMDYISGKLLSELLEIKADKKVLKEIGKNIASLHKADIIHGDLTTSNMIWDSKLYFIDFGLGFRSKKVEDKAVDLHLLKQAFESKHSNIAKQSFKLILKEYRKTYSEANKVFTRLKKVEERGRYKRKQKARAR